MALLDTQAKRGHYVKSPVAGTTRNKNASAGWCKDSRVVGALGPWRDLFTLTSILSHQGRGGKPLRAGRPNVFSSHSLIPAGAGTPRNENWVHWLIEGFRCRLCPPPLPWLGTSPSPTALLRPSAVVVRAAVVRYRRPVPGSIHFRTNRSSRLAPAHQDMKTLSCGFIPRIRTWNSATPRPDPSGGQAPALHWPWGDCRRFLD